MNLFLEIHPRQREEVEEEEVAVFLRVL